MTGYLIFSVNYLKKKKMDVKAVFLHLTFKKKKPGNPRTFEGKSLIHLEMGYPIFLLPPVVGSYAGIAEQTSFIL